MKASPAPAEIVPSDREKGPSDWSAPVVRPRARLWASRRAKPSSNDTIDPSTDDDKSSVEVEKGKADGPPKVGFFKLFRFATTAELGLDVLGIVAAVAAGAAQPLMTLILGRFTTSFTTFATVLIQLSTDPTNEQLRTAFRQAQDAVKADTSRNAIWLTIIGAGNFVAIYIFMCTWIYSGERLSKRIREKYLQAVLRQDIEFFDKVGAGEVATRIQTDTHLIQEGVSEKVALTAMYMSTFVTGYVLAYIRCWRLALAITSVLPVMAILGGAAGYFVSKYSTQNLEHKAASGTLAEEVLSTVRTVKSFSMVQKFGALFEEHVEASKRIGYKVALAMGVVTGGMFFVIYCGYSIALVYGARLINQGRADSGIVITVLFSIFIGSFSIMMMATQVNSVFKAMGAASKIYETIDRVPPIDSADEGGLKPSTCEGRLTFEGTSFHYPSRPGITVLSDFTASFPPGKTTALVGASGSGKTTIVSLLLRFYDPVTGSVKLDGHDLRDLNLKWLRQQIGYVQQEPVLFMQSVRTNIEFGLLGTCHENASPEEKLQLVKAAAIKSNAHEFVSLLPDGYDTHVGEGGLLLSGGQKQRIAIARAIVSDPTILLLDEATSALDTVSEGLVQEALDRASAGRTTVTIAHRLSTVKDAHQIIVMGNGKLLECGSHQTLLAQDGNYAQQVLAQNLRGNDLGQSSTTLAGGLSNSDAVASEEKGGARKDLQDVEEAVQELGKGGATAAVDNKPSTSLLPYRTLGKRLYQINNSDRVYYMSGCIFALASGFVFPGFSILFGQAISNFSEPNPSRLQTKSDRTALWIFVVAIISALVEGLQNWTFMRTADGLEAKVRSLSFRAMLRNDVAWYDEPEHTTGSLTSRLTEDATKITGLAGMTLGKIFAAFATILAGAVIGLAYGWELALIAIACMPVILSMGYIELHVVRLKDQKNKEQHEESAHLACEAAGAIKTVASLTREDDACRTYNRSLEEPLRKSKRTMLKANALFAFSQAANLWVVALIFWIGSRWLVDLRYSVNDFFVILQASVFGATQAGGVFAFVPDASKAQQAATDVIRLLDQRPKIDLESTEGKVSHAAARGHLRFDNVSFGYPTRSGSLVLRDLTIDAPPGSYIALVGASGCGKSTTIQLIERFYDPLSGTITLDGVPISDLNVTSYRSQVALVSQEPTLYAGSIKFNILLGANRPEEEISQEEIVNACRNANILEFIESLPDGFDTAVGGKGAQLSGGQKQRIAIARALIRNPKVLLLDEATSALDSSSEKVVQAALDNAAKGRTTIAIAHRLSTVQRADRIYFIKEGGVAEQGTHEELLKLGGDYAQLVGLQVLSKVD